MLELYFGTDTTAVRGAAMAAVARLVSTGARLERLEPERWSVGTLAEIIGSTSLFGEVTVYVVDTPSSDEVWNSVLVKALKELAVSANPVVVIEGGLLAAEKKRYEAVAARMEEFQKVATDTRFDPFILAEALITKDKKTLWILLQKAFASGLSAEEIIGTLWWQLKTIRLTMVTKTAAEAGVKDYPYNKAKRALTVYKPEDIVLVSRRLLTVYHEGHAGIKDISIGLEEWVLSL